MRKLAILFVVGAAASVATADVIISNHPGNDLSQSAGINGDTRTKGMGFEMPGLAYFLDDVVLRLNITDTAVVPVIEIFSDAGGPGASLITLNNPGSFTPGIGDYTFTPAGSFTLQASTVYWIVASSANSVYDMKASSPSQTPTGVATHVGATWGTYPPQSSSGILVTYFIDATPVPAPSSLALLGLGGLALRRRR